MAASKGPAQQPGWPRRLVSTVVMGMTGVMSKVFIYGLNRVEVVGLDGFLKMLDSRRDVEKRQRGLITGVYSYLTYLPACLPACLPIHFVYLVTDISYTPRARTLLMEPCLALEVSNHISV